MAWNIQCNNKGCWEYQNPMLDVVKNDKGEVDFDKSQVICSECEQPITSVTGFTKRSMYGMGQVKRDTQHQKAFTIECPRCSKKDQPVQAKDQIACSHCGLIYDHLPAPYLQSVKQFLGINS